jgi:ketosteroid isomerase-like protein
MKVTFFATLFLMLFNFSSCTSPEIIKEKQIAQQSFQEHSPLAHHKVALEVLEASKTWINAFNNGNSQQCVDGYSDDAVIHATPFGVKKGTQEIMDFWKPFIASGASNLVYTNVHIEVANETTAFLGANWSMNIGKGIIYQEKWEKINDKWVLTYDDFEVLEQFATPKENKTPPTESHTVLEAVINASRNWTNGFNNQNSTICGNAYAKEASMNAIPFASLHDKKSIHDFWAKLIADGARNLTYHNPTFQVLTTERVLLTSSWSMNIGEGKIYQEKWIKEDGNWVLGYDEFQVLKQY